MNFSKEHFVSEEVFTEFETGLKVFYGELFRLNTTIYILEQIVKFPFGLFGDMNRMSFFNMLLWSFFDTALLIITRLMTDQGGDKHTFSRFKNKIIKDWIKPEYKSFLIEHLKQARTDGSIKLMLSRVIAIRNEYVAHLSENLILGKTTYPYPIYLSELIDLRDRANALFDSLTLRCDVEYLMVPLEYSSIVTWPQGTDPRSDIEQILDDVVKRSVLLNMPEDNPVRWQFHRENLSEAEIAQINHYRRKFELPEV